MPLLFTKTINRRMSSRESASDKSDRQDPSSNGRAWPGVLIVVVTLAAYWNSFAGVFLFDDRIHILGDRRLTSLWSIGKVLGRRRPIVDYSLAVNYAIGGENAWGYHAVNLLIHLLAGLTLFGIVRRTLLREPLRRRLGSASVWLALIVAVIWAVHPLQTQSVTYVIQRAESLMGLFYLLTLYCVIRGVDSSGRIKWYVAAVIFCALGMGSKAVMVTAPAMVLLYDRVFVSTSMARALRLRWGLYVGLGATWGVLWMCNVVQGVFDPSRPNAHVGFAFKGITPLEYLWTQCGVLLRYLELAICPRSLCLDYNWPVARTVRDMMPQAVVLVALLAATLRAVGRRRLLGFVGAWFFIILSPTSTFIPIRDPLFEHRMYLPLAAVVVLVVISAHFALQRLAAGLSWRDPIRRCVAAVLTAAVVASLLYGTVRRNRVYGSETRMWRDVLTKCPHNPRAAKNLGLVLLAEGKTEEALVRLREAVRISPGSATVRNGLGVVLVANGLLDEAIESFREAVRLEPYFAWAHLNLGNALSDKGLLDEAMEQFQTALRVRPNYAEARLNLGNALLEQRKINEAIEQYRVIIRLNPRHAKAWGNLGTALLSKSQISAVPDNDALNRTMIDEAIEAFRTALDLNPSAQNVHNSLGIALASQGRLDEGIESLNQALELKPGFAGAHYNLANCLIEKGDIQEAIHHYSEAVRIEPHNLNARFKLGVALAKQGYLQTAIETFRQVLKINPHHSGARKALEAVQAEQPSSTLGRN